MAVVLGKMIQIEISTFFNRYSIYSIRSKINVNATSSLKLATIHPSITWHHRPFDVRYVISSLRSLSAARLFRLSSNRWASAAIRARLTRLVCGHFGRGAAAGRRADAACGVPPGGRSEHHRLAFKGYVHGVMCTLGRSAGCVQSTTRSERNVVPWRSVWCR